MGVVGFYEGVEYVTGLWGYDWVDVLKEVFLMGGQKWGFWFLGYYHAVSH